MKVKTITYQRVLNLGNYENKKLEVHAELDDGDDVNQAISDLKEITESNIRSEILTKFEENIKLLKQEQRELRIQNLDLRDDVNELIDKKEEYEKKLGIFNEVAAQIPFDQESEILDSEILNNDPDPLRFFDSGSEISPPPTINPEVSDPSNKNTSRDWNQKIPEFKSNNDDPNFF